MKGTVKKYGYVKSIAFTALAIGCLFTSNAHAVIAGEAHACRANSATGGWWIGGYYRPATRSAATVVRNERRNLPTRVQVDLYAYDNNMRRIGRKLRTMRSAVGMRNADARAAIKSVATAPGHVISFNNVWSPSGLRSGGITLTPPFGTFGSNGCKSQVFYL